MFSTIKSQFWSIKVSLSQLTMNEYLLSDPLASKSLILKLWVIEYPLSSSPKYIGLESYMVVSSDKHFLTILFNNLNLILEYCVVRNTFSLLGSWLLKVVIFSPECDFGNIKRHDLQYDSLEKLGKTNWSTKSTVVICVQSMDLGPCLSQKCASEILKLIVYKGFIELTLFFWRSLLLIDFWMSWYPRNFWAKSKEKYQQLTIDIFILYLSTTGIYKHKVNKQCPYG